MKNRFLSIVTGNSHVVRTRRISGSYHRKIFQTIFTSCSVMYSIVGGFMIYAYSSFQGPIAAAHCASYGFKPYVF